MKMITLEPTGRAAFDARRARQANPRAAREKWVALLMLLVMIGQTLTPLLPLILPLQPPAGLEPTPPVAARPQDAPGAVSGPATQSGHPHYALPGELAGKAEIVELRTAHSATFRLDNGDHAQVFDVQPLHYQDAAGAWQPILPRFVRQGERWVNDQNTIDLQVEPTFSSARVGTTQTAVSWHPLALEFAGPWGAARKWATPLLPQEQQPGHTHADGSGLRFENSWQQGVADQWTATPGEVEYTLRLAQRPEPAFWQRTPETFDLRVRLALFPGVVIEIDGEPVTLPLETDRALTFRGPGGEEMTLQPPRTYEQHDPTQAVDGRYQLSATPEPGVLELRVRTPWPWLAASERTYPVIIDPVFQIRGPTGLWHMQLNGQQPDDPPGFFDRRELGSALVGRLGDTVFRSIVRYPIPRMPVGTQIDRAYLYALPTGHSMAVVGADQSALQLPIALHAIQNSEWLDGAALAYDQTPIAPGPQQLVHTNNTQARTGIHWDITSLAQQWLVTAPNAPMVDNHGLLLRSPEEFCIPHILPQKQYHNPFCGLLQFGTQASSWDESELANTQTSESADNPTFVPTAQGGLRLVVFYRNNNLLLENVPAGVDLPGGGGTPQAVAPYFKSDHLYRLPPLSDSQWQALVVRGLGPRVGVNPPQGPEQIFRRPVQGALHTNLRTGNDVLELTGVTPSPDTIGYILYNGGGNPFPTFDQETLVRVAGVEGARPTSYDIRFVSQQGSISTIENGTTPKPTAQKLTLSHHSADPLALYNIMMPVGTNSRVMVTVNSDGTKDQEYLKQHGMDFNIKLVNADAQVDLITSTPNPRSPHFGDGADRSLGPFQGIQEPAGGITRYQSEIFPASAGQWALAIAYNGPEIISFTVPECLQEFCSDPPQVIPIRYTIEISVHSCPAHQMPTSSGVCQTVQCPTAAAFPAGSPQYVEIAGFALWSQAEWMSAGGTALKSRGQTFPAPFIGPPAAQNVRQAPTTAVIGGDITYNTGVTPNTVTINNADVLLVNCRPPANNVTTFEYFQVYKGNMTLGSGATPNFVPSGSPRVNMVDPWPATDRAAGDIGNETLSLWPRVGEYRGSAVLRRTTGFDIAANTLFNTQWTVNVNGWPSLGSAISLNNLGQLERIAGLTLTLGVGFSLDTPNAKDRQTPRRFAGVRAMNAQVAQDARMGGASKMLKAVLLPRGVAVPSEPSQLICPHSCIDLRAPSELFGQPLNRVWEMPDIHTDTQAATVAYSSEGRMIVYSVDHPALLADAAGANFAQSFSFDAYKATVSVTNEPCEAGQMPGLVIRGETRIAMPNIGSTTDPAAGITAKFKLCETPPDGVGMREVLLRFESPVGLPIGASGMFLTALGGQVRIRPEGTRIEVDVAFQTEPTGPGGILRATGKVVIDSQGLFAFKGEARLLGVFDAGGSLWVAWNPMDIGFTVSGGYEDWLRGTVSAHMWRGRGWNNYTWLPDNNDMHFTASIAATLQIPAGAVVDWGPLVIPPFDIGLSVALEFGEFCTNPSCTRYEFGIKGNFKVLGESIGLYYGFKTGLDFILGNDDHILIDQYGGAQATPVSIGEQTMNDAVEVYPGPSAVDGVSLIPLSISPQAESFLVGVGWQAGSPTVSLIDPDGVEISAVNGSQHGAEFQTTPSSTIVTVENPKAGLWQARLGDLSEAGVEHYKFVFFADRGQPGTPANRGALLSPAAPNEPAGELYTISWQTPEDMPEHATLALYYRRTEVITGNLQIDVPIVRNLPAQSGSYEWDTRRMAAGTYAIRAVIDDGVNELPTTAVTIPDDTCLAVTTGLPRRRAFDPARFPGFIELEAPGTVQIVDNAPPDVPGGLTLHPTDGAILARWNPAAAVDVGAYELLWGLKNAGEPLGFTVQNRTLIATGGELNYRIGAVSNALEYGVAVRAVDVSGNASAPSAAQFATPDSTVNPVPSMPIDLQVTGRTSTSANLTWLPGPGPAPAGYRVYYSLIGPVVSTLSTDVTGPSVTLTQLQTGGYYAVRVAAHNDGGWFSPPGEPTYLLITNGVDADGDGLYDDWAAVYGVDDPQGDEDGDGLTNLEEQTYGSNPTRQDSDGDGLSDGEEIAAGTVWYDDQSYGVYTLPRLAVENRRLRFVAKQQAGGEAPAQSIGWANVGGGNLLLAATTASPWLLPAVHAESIQVDIDHGNLAPGFYSGVIQLRSTPGSGPLVGPPTCIRVNAWILAADDDIPQKLAQTIQFEPLPNRRIDEPPFTLQAAASSSLPVSFVASPPQVCTVAEDVVTLTGVGQCTIAALQLGDSVYLPAPQVNRTFSVVAVDVPLYPAIYVPFVER